MHVVWQHELNSHTASSSDACLSRVASLRVDPHILGLRVALRGVARAWSRPILALNPWGRNGLLHGCLHHELTVINCKDCILNVRFFTAPYVQKQDWCSKVLHIEVVCNRTIITSASDAAINANAAVGTGKAGVTW